MDRRRTEILTDNTYQEEDVDKTDPEDPIVKEELPADNKVSDKYEY
jgi:hypothetical protein